MKLLAIITAVIMMNSCNGQTHQPVVRPATQANRFYTGDPEALSHEVDSVLACHKERQVFNNVAALIVPHAGYYYSGNVAAAAYMTLDPQKPPKRIFLLGPSHHEWLDGASVNTEADYYATPLGNVKVDHETALKLTAATDSAATGLEPVFTYRPEAHDREHCLEVQLPFLQRRFGEVPPIVPVIISTNDFTKLKRMAEVLKPYLNDDNLFIISSDFSHYPAYDDACEADARTGKAIGSGSIEQLIAALETNARSGKPNLATSACGQYAILTLMLMFDGHCDIRHLLYQNSGDIRGERDRVVGYHAFAFLRSAQDDTTFTLTADDKRLLKSIAYESISDSLDGKSLSPAPSIPEQSSPTRSLSLFTLSYFGGFEMVAAIGAMLRAAEQHLVILVDGFIMTACALAAIQLEPKSRDYMIFTHSGDEVGHRKMLDAMGASPLVSLGLRLGEGTGALCAFPIVDSAVRMVNEMNNFQNASITKYF